MGARVPPARAVIDGLTDTLSAPLVLLMAAIVTMLMTAPFALVLGTRLEIALSTQPPVDLDDTEIDPEWWQEFGTHARGLEATFTPAVIGFAAPLDGISAVLDGRQPPLAVLGPLALSIVMWAFLWGGILRRFAAGRAIGARAFIGAGVRFAPRFVVIALLSTIAIVLLYATVHAMLFGPLYRTLVSTEATELRRFLVRVLLYVVFFALLAFVSLIADYARVASAAGAAQSVAEAFRASAVFVRSNLRAVTLLYLLTALVFVAVTIGYGVLEIYGGSPAGGWRAVAIGQAYILVRLAIRLTTAAAELRLFGSGATR